MAVAQPEVIQNYLFPISDQLTSKILAYRDAVNELMEDFRRVNRHKLLIITGPSTLNNPLQSKHCAQWISKLSGKRSYKVSFEAKNKLPAELGAELKHIYENDLSPDSIMLSMRANYTAYEESQDPLRETKEVKLGLPLCRTLMHELAKYCPLTVSLSNTISPQYYSDLCCLGLVDSTLLESQLHREIVSGVSYPCGFEVPSSSEYHVSKGKEAIFASSFPHSFLTITKNGSVAQVETTGNRDTFLVIRTSDCDNNNEVLNAFHNLDTNTKLHGQLKIVVDIGKLNSDNYNTKCELVTSLIKNPKCYSKLIGFMIDSGDVYLPQNTQVEQISSVLHEQYEEEQFSNLRQKLLRNDEPHNNNFDAFLLANQMISRIVWANR